MKKVTSLDGKWNFYWKNKTFKDYQQNKDSLHAEFINVPGEWGWLNYPEFGYGLYTMKVIGIDPSKKLGLKISPICNAFNLYINGKLLTTGGLFGTTQQNSLADYNPTMISFLPDTDTLEIAFEVSNFYYR